jgi:hypothetical protein
LKKKNASCRYISEENRFTVATEGFLWLCWLQK